MKTIAYYLPQYHRIDENDKWWGDGFTEWTNVRAGTPLFPGHEQPVVPLGNNYYSLDDRRTVEWQTQLAKKYCIDGFAYYHYWFNGKMLLERPAERLLKWQDIDQPFFFFWANHSWMKNKKGKKEILMMQEYGGNKDHIAHYQYLSKFFKDERYIKVANKPVIGVYKPHDIPDYLEMVECWNTLAVRDGFDGVYVIKNIDQSKNLNDGLPADAAVLRQPAIAQEKLMRGYGFLVSRPKLCKVLRAFLPFRIKYEKVIDKLINDAQILESQCEMKLYQGTFTGWDNTVRHGRMGYVHVDSNPTDFRRSLEALDKITEPDDFVFINAWNEWAEGMYLEPCEKWGYSYLEAVRDSKGVNR